MIAITKTAIQELLLPLFIRVCLIIALIICHCQSATASWNNPYPQSHSEQNIFYSHFDERPKHLDPIRAYGAEEFLFIEQIYQPPLQYHFLRRPYELEPLILKAMPHVRFLSADGQLITDNESADIAFTDYTLNLKRGVRFQPHPALAKDKQGRYRYHQLNTSDIKNYHTLADFAHTGSREMTAADIANQIKRFAHPGLHSPLSGLMQKHILGMDALSKKLEETLKTQESNYIDLRQYSLSGITVKNDYQLTIRLKGQYPQFIYWLAMPFFAPMPWEAEAFYAQKGMKEQNLTLDWFPIGTGPYMLEENNPNLRMTLIRNPNFHGETYPEDGEPGDAEKGLLDDAGKPLPFIDKAIYSLEKETIPSWNKFLQGYYDNSGIGSDSFDQVINTDSNGNVLLADDMQAKGISLITSVRSTIFYFGFNMLDKVVGGDSEKSRLLRQAISIALDYEEFVSIFLNGRGQAAQGPIPPGIFGFTEGEQGINPFVYDWVNGKPQRKSIDAAKQLLAQAGYSDGIDAETGKALVLYFDSYDASPTGKARLNWLRKQFKKLNIQLVIRNTDINRFREKMNIGNAQMFFWGWGADYPDPENFLFLLHGPNSKVKHKGPNYSNFVNDEFDALFHRMKNMSNSPERKQLVDDMVDIVREQSPWAFGLFPQGYSLHHAWYKNAKPNLMTHNTLKYKRIIPELRQQSRQQWNQPILWPVIVIVGLLALLIVPAIVSYRRFERSRAL